MSVVNDAARVAVVALDTGGRIQVFNETSHRITGFTQQELCGREIFDVLIPAEQREAVREVFKSILADEIPDSYENDWLTTAGDRRRLRWDWTLLRDAVGQVQYVVGMGVDVTGEHVARSSARRHADELQKLVDACPALVGEVDADYRFIFANTEYRRQFGLDPASLRGQHIERVIGPDAFRILKPSFDRALAGSIATYDGPVPYSKGIVRVMHAVYVPRTNDEGGVHSFYVMAVDLTNQANLASELADSATRGQAVLDTAVDAILTIDASGRIESFNRAAEQMFGYAASEVSGRNVSMLMRNPYHSEHDNYIERYLETGDKRVIGSGREVTAKRRDGSLFPIELAVGEFEARDERHFTWFIRDTTERKRIEAEARQRLNQLAHVNRVSAMDALASGISHEVNQPLTAIVATSRACLHMMDRGSASLEFLRDALEQVERQAERASSIIREMRGLLRKVDDQRTSRENVGCLLHGMQEILQHEINAHDVQLRVIVEKHLPEIEVNRVQIEQVMLNLMRNAVEAMAVCDGPRRLMVRARRAGKADSMVEIVVRDNGRGVADDIRDRLFEPFVTNKPAGMGQGLSISRSIVRAHGGDITLEPESGNGTCFCVRLPFAGDGAAA